MVKTLLRTLILCTLLLGVMSVVFFADNTEVMAYEKYGENCADCHGGGSGDSGSSDESSSDESSSDESSSDESSSASVPEDAEASDESSGATVDAEEELAEEPAAEPVDEGLKGIPLVVGGLIFIAGVTGLSMTRKRN